MRPESWARPWCCPPLAIGREGRQPLVGVVPAIKADTVDFMMALDPAVLFGKAQLKGGGEEGDFETV